MTMGWVLFCWTISAFCLGPIIGKCIKEQLS
jgi:hypothetical protein